MAYMTAVRYMCHNSVQNMHDWILDYVSGTSLSRESTADLFTRKVHPTHLMRG